MSADALRKHMEELDADRQSQPTYLTFHAAMDLLRETEQKLKLAVDACVFVKNFLNNLEDTSDPRDPLRKMREDFHAPLHAKLDEGIQRKTSKTPEAAK